MKLLQLLPAQCTSQIKVNKKKKNYLPGVSMMLRRKDLFFVSGRTSVTGVDLILTPLCKTLIITFKRTCYTQINKENNKMSFFVADG